MAVGLTLNFFAPNMAYAEYTEETAMIMAKVSAGASHSLIIDSVGSVWAWKNNWGSKLIGNEEIEHNSGPVEVLFE